MSNVAEAIATLTKVLSEQPEKAQTKNVPATAVLHEGLKFRVSGPRGEKVLTDMFRARVRSPHGRLRASWSWSVFIATREIRCTLP
jgi:hypothetical protein